MEDDLGSPWGLKFTFVGRPDDSVRVSNYFYWGYPGQIGGIRFADGTVWDSMEVIRQLNRPTDENQSLVGTDAVDVIEGGGGNDSLYGRGGDDVLSGGTGDDYLTGEQGNDSLDGGEVNDRLYGNDGDELLMGGDGDDEKAEANATRRLLEMESSTPGAHFADRHGAHLPLSSQYNRAASGINPTTGVVQNIPLAATHFYSSRVQ